MSADESRISVTDDVGQQLVFDKAPERIVSLTPTITETLIEMGAGNRVVGITNYCTHPARAVDNLARVGGTKSIVLEKVHALKPDLVIANREENRRRHIDALRESYPVFITHPRSVEQALKMVGGIGLLTRTSAKATEIAEQCKQALSSVDPQARSKTIATACLIWRDPWMAVGPGGYVNDLLETFGFRNIFKPDDGRYPETNLETLARRKAEIVLLPNERYAFGEPDRKEVGAFLAEKGRSARVQIVEGSYLTWFGYRTIQGLRFLGQLKQKLVLELQP